MTYKFWKIFSLEFLQNLPLVCAFIIGNNFYKHGNIIITGGIVFIFVLLGALIIRFTEPLITADTPESHLETILNIVFFTIAIGLVIRYFNLPGNPITDLALGAGMGLLLGFLQARAERRNFKNRHTLALILSFSAAMIIIRSAALLMSPIGGIMILTTITSFLVAQIEYLYK